MAAMGHETERGAVLARELVEGRLVKGLGGEAVALGGPGRKQHGLLLAIPTHLGSPALTILIADNGYRPPVFGPLPSITQGSRLRIGAKQRWAGYGGRMGWPGPICRDEAELLGCVSCGKTGRPTAPAEPTGNRAQNHRTRGEIETHLLTHGLCFTVKARPVCGTGQDENLVLAHTPATGHTLAKPGA